MRLLLGGVTVPDSPRPIALPDSDDTDCYSSYPEDDIGDGPSGQRGGIRGHSSFIPRGY